MGSHLVGAFVSIPQNKHDQSGSSFRIEQKLHHHQSGDSNIFKPSTPLMPIKIYNPKIFRKCWNPQVLHDFPRVETPKIPLFHNDSAALPRNRSCSKAWRLRINRWTESRRTCCGLPWWAKESSWVFHGLKWDISTRNGGFTMGKSWENHGNIWGYPAW